jgi:hypothetical protein
MPLHAHTAKFVVTKKMSDEDRTTGTIALDARNRRAACASSAGNMSAP